MLKLFYFFMIATCMLAFSCGKKSEEFISGPASSYYPLQTGKYITYNLDSTVFVNFGERDTVISYQVQDRVDALITDNTGRPAYRIIRFIRKNENQDWLPNNTFMAIPTDHSVEFIENNLRYIKLSLPIAQDFTWKGNSYIDTYSLDSELKYLDDWDYTYDSVNMPLQLGNIMIDSALVVRQRDEFLGQDPSEPGTQYAEKNYSVEKYGAGIGLVYKEFIHWEYQGSQPDRNAYYIGYGVTLTMTGHN